MYKLRPKYWFSAHMHVRFEATVNFSKADQSSSKKTKISNPDEIILSSDEESENTELSDSIVY